MASATRRRFSETPPRPLSRRAQFIVIEGPDGAGKATLAHAVATLLADRGMRHLRRRQISTASTYAATLMEPLARVLWQHNRDIPDMPDHFWAHIQSAWFTAHGEHVVRPALEAGHVLVDGWYYRLASELLAHGYDADELDGLFARVRTPDHVVLLRVAPATLWERKTVRLQSAEFGMHNDDADRDEESFLGHQGQCLDNLMTMATANGWTVLDVAADESDHGTSARLADTIADLLDASEAAAPSLSYTWPHIDPSLRRAVRRQLDVSLSDRDARGVIGEFERAFAAFIGSRHAIAFSSGTSALHAMCVAAGLHEGDEVIAPAYTFFATTSPFAYEGVRVVFADADALGNLDPADLPRQLTDRTRAVIVTHMWGNPCDMTAITAFCDQHGLLLLEDCSHAHFAAWGGQRVGTFGGMAAFSTNQKAITTGEGGVLVTDDDRFRDLVLLHGHYNKRCFTEIDRSRPYYPYALTGMGLKARATTLGAAIGLDQLAKADAIEARRRQVIDLFLSALDGNPVVSPVVVAPHNGAHGLYVMGLRYHSDGSTIPIGEFIDRLTGDGAEFDIPGSTGIIAHEPLFHRPVRAAGWDAVPAVPDATYPGAATFIGSFFKGPLWGYAGDDDAVEHQIVALVRLTQQVAR